MNVAYDPELDGILALAAQAYRRHDDDTFHALLLDAIRRAPHRFDLGLNFGNHCIQRGMVDAALSSFAGLVDDHPGDPDLLTYLAHWQRYSENDAESEKWLGRLSAVRPERASDLSRIWASIDYRLSLMIADALPDLPGGAENVAIVTLGLELSPDGSMRQSLVDRLEKTLEAADRYRDSQIIVTGGVPRSGRIEARAMRDWLIDKGISAERIHEEGYARDLVENLLYSRHILNLLKARTAVIITSSNNVRRAGACMEIIAWVGGFSLRVPPVVPASGESLTGFIDDGGDRLKLYRDALRAYGLPMMHTYPGLVEL